MATAQPEIGGLTFAELQGCLLLGATLEQVHDLATAGFTVDQIHALSASLGKAKAQGGGISAEDLRAVLLDQRKAMRPENATHPAISAFSYPEGDVAREKPALRRETFFAGVRQTIDSLTPAEIDLFNRFETSKTARNGLWKAEVRRNGTAEQLWITTEPNTLDARMSLPGLTSILRELLDGAEAANPDRLAERVAELEALIRRQGTLAA